MEGKQLVGQHTDKSPYNKLVEWLRDWSKNNLNPNKEKKKGLYNFNFFNFLAKPSPWAAQSDGSSFRAVLLSGPPGIIF